MLRETRARRWISTVALCLALAGCRGVEPPYPPDQPPHVADLLAAAAPSLTSIQVPRAKIRQGGGPAANLMLVAQSPARFAGTLQVAGNELVSLAVNEESYGLRWVGGREGAGARAPGFYSGPPSRCAVESLLGVELEPETLVDVLLGGAPLIDPPHVFVDRSWDRKRGRELLRIQNDQYQQELEFVWLGNRWQFAGATLWSLAADGSTSWRWTIRHEDLHVVDGAWLPTKTQITQPKPSGRGELTLNVSFQKQIANPPLGGSLPSEPPREGEDGPPPNAGDGWDDDWDDEDGSGEDETEPEPEPEKAPIPPQFIGNPTGLTPRGDPCAGRR